MEESRLVKRYPHIKDEDVISIFMEGYDSGFVNGRKRAIPIEWIIKWECGFLKPNGEQRRVIKEMLHDWEKENETN